MDIFDIKNAIFFGFFLSFMIGPVFFMLIQTSIVKGARAAIAFNLGVILGDVAFIVIAYFGSRHLLERIKDDPRLFFIGGLILIVYGAITYLDKAGKKDIEESLKLPTNNNYFKLILKGFFLNFINVGVLAFWLGLIVVIGPTLDMNPTYIFLLFWYYYYQLFYNGSRENYLSKTIKKQDDSSCCLQNKTNYGYLINCFWCGFNAKRISSKRQQD